MTNISKISGVIFVTETGKNPKSYFGQQGKYTVWDDNTGVRVDIGGVLPSEGDVYNIALSDLQVNGQTPNNITEAKVLLNAIFST